MSSQIQEIAAIVGGILAGPTAAIYVEADHLNLTVGHKINMQRLVKDAIQIRTLIAMKVFSMDAHMEEKTGGTSD